MQVFPTPGPLPGHGSSELGGWVCMCVHSSICVSGGWCTHACQPAAHASWFPSPSGLPSHKSWGLLHKWIQVCGSKENACSFINRQEVFCWNNPEIKSNVWCTFCISSGIYFIYPFMLVKSLELLNVYKSQHPIINSMEKSRIHCNHPV